MLTREEGKLLARTTLLAARDAGIDFYERTAVEEASRNPAVFERGAMSKRFYASGNGDTWALIRDADGSGVRVGHVPNAASGGAPSEIELDAFLARDKGSPQNDALLAFIGAAAGSPFR